MKLILIIAIAVVCAVVLLVGVIALLGSRLAKEHVASRSILLHKQPAEVYAVVHDFASAPKWRTDIQRVDVTTQPDGKIHFREIGKHDVVNYEVLEDVLGERFATRILDTDLGYSGTWTYVLAPEAGGTRLTITEQGEVSNVFFRFMSRYVFGHTATIDGYLTSLANRFGESSSPQ